MIEDWQETRIEDIAERIAMGPFGSDIKVDNFVPQGVPIIRGGNLSSGRFNDDNFVYLTEEKADKLSAANAFQDDIVFTHRGTLGQVGIIPKTKFARYVVSQSQMKLTCKTNLAAPPFIYYFFKSNIGQQALLINTSQTGVPAISRPVTSLKNITILLPSLPEQRRIAHILGTLDDKIENNRKTAKTLEAMAQAIFQSWFVDFDPVRAKMAGESRESICERLKLTPEILDLFPDRLVDSELGEIPEGWRVGRVLDFGDIICGKTPPKKNPEFFGKGIPFIKIPDMHDWVYVISPSEQLTALGEATQANKTIPAGTICVSCIATVGEVVLTHERSQTNQQINSIVPKHEETTVYLYFQMIEKKGLFTDLASAGSTTLNMNTSTFSKINILVPKINILKAFSSVITTLFKGILMTQKEIKTISGIRDALLPKLISGEARVPDADHLHKRL